MIYDITPITFNQLDLLSAGHPQGGLQQTGHMAHLAAPDVEATDLIGVTRNGVLTAGCLIAWTRGRFGLEGSIWLGPLVAPHWGAWIEIQNRIHVCPHQASRTPLGCVD